MDERDFAKRRKDRYDPDFDQQAMTLTYLKDDEEEFTVRARWEVCSTCDGRGHHVNPSIDSNGITGDEMYELGPDFIEDYTSGVYDVTCYDCDGRTTVPRPATDERAELLKRVDDYWQEIWEYESMCESERRKGA